MMWDGTWKVGLALGIGWWRVCQWVGLPAGAVVYLVLAVAGVVR